MSVADEAKLLFREGDLVTTHAKSRNTWIVVEDFSEDDKIDGWRQVWCVRYDAEGEYHQRRFSWKALRKAVRPDIDAIEARERRATPLPWKYGPKCIEFGPGDYGGLHILCHNGINRRGDCYDVTRTSQKDDMQFAASARTDVPALTKYVRHLEQENATLRRRLSERNPG